MKLDEEEFKRACELLTEFKKQSKAPLELIEELKKFQNELLAKRNIKTKAPKQWITPIDKVSNKSFDGEGTLYEENEVEVDIGRSKSGKKILTLARLDYSDKSIQISGKKELTQYDREVHDALVTLYIDGGNEYITPQMIYKAMTGNPEAKLAPKQQEAISNSLNKLMYSRLIIKDSKEECKAYCFDKFTYEGAVIQGEKATVKVNGVIVEVYHLLREPALYSYANLKNQICRLDIQLLNSPVNKNGENITLQGYLLRRINGIKRSKLSPTILYNTIYEQLDIQASSDGALRKKKLKVRNTVKKILDYLKAHDFIKSHTENSHGHEVTGITISY
ncbi:MAG: hypothetical protein U0L03_04320 [Succinivibrionaceae bacterium]|nr:hypothetical protein [Succinivibrionaceae bacterium]